jgi:fimbrial isopeptide formation D2 family protein/uncharacterized repeat protein (TIGR01451 family)
MLAAQPVVTLDAGDAPIGGQATITIGFDNQPDASGGSNTGYAPYIDLILPHNGEDGPGVGSLPPFENDGVSFVSASYLGTPVAGTVIEFDAAGQATHPFAQDAAGNLRVVNAADYGAAPGDQLVVLRLPFGSFVPDQPVAEVKVTVDVSPLADLGVPLTVAAVGGFAFGRDPANDPTTDPPVLGTAVTDTITPTVLTLAKVYNGPEGETATGPNFPRSYTISLDVATGQPLTSVSLTDLLPDGIVLVGAPVLSGLPGTATYVVDPGTGTHRVDVLLDDTVTGVAGVDATVTINFYVGEFLAPGDPATPVLDPISGAPRTLENNVTAQADWVPLDPRDTPTTLTVNEPGPEAVFVARALATQKSQSLFTDLNSAGLGPGDTIQYAINIQVSDYFDFSGVVLDDLLSDGQAYVAGSARLEVVEAGSTNGSGLFAAPNIEVVRDPTTGVTSFRFRISDQLAANGADDSLMGGDGGGGATTLRIVYQALVESTYVATGAKVVQGDVMSNAATVTGDVLDAGGIPTGFTPGDVTSSSARVATGVVDKEIYALNGVLLAPGAAVAVGSGDLVTFRLTYALPHSLLGSLSLTDFLPLPIFDVSTFTLTGVGGIDATPPDENEIKFGPDATGFSTLPSGANLSFDVASNSLTLLFTGFNTSPPVGSVADILFTLRVTDRPFGDGLLFTNQVLGTEIAPDGSTVVTSTDIRQLTLTEPGLRITKGIVATDNPDGIFSPGAVGPVAFTPPGSALVRFAGTIDSAGLLAKPVDSDLADVDAGDRVSFAIIVENTGQGVNGAFDIVVRDNLPDGFRIPATGLNLYVTNGAGTALAHTGNLFFGGLNITDPGGPMGVLTPYAASSGTNILVITYDLELSRNVEVRDQITNLAEIRSYAAVEGGVDRVPTSKGPVEDIATTETGDPDFIKIVTATSVTETGSAAGDPSLPDLTIGETITFDLVATLREGRTRLLVLTDDLPISPGRLDFVSAGLVSIGANLFLRNADGSAGAALGAPSVTQSGGSVRFEFADDILNLADNAVTDADRIVVRVTAVLVDVVENQSGVALENTGTLSQDTATPQPLAISDIATAEIVEPSFTLDKVADRELVQGGDIVTYTVSVTPVASAFAGPIFDLLLFDSLNPGRLTLVSGSLTLLTGPAGTVLREGDVGGTLGAIAEVPLMLPGQTLRFTYQASVEATVVAGTTIPNLVRAEGDSHPGIPPVLIPPDPIQRVFLGLAQDSVRVPGDGIVKTVAVADTSLVETGSAAYDTSRPDLAIGEVVTYRITVTFPEAISTDVRMIDLLPGAIAQSGADAGLFEYVSASINRVGASLSYDGSGLHVADDRSGDGIADRVTFTLGNVTNTPDGIRDGGDEIEFLVTARVRDAAVNKAGQAPVNTAEVNFSTGIAQATARVDIVEPAVRVDKVASETRGDAGDVVSYALRLDNGNSNAGPAFDLVVTDTIPLGMEIVAGTLRFSAGSPTGASLAYDSGTRVITATIPTYLTTDTDIVIAYDTRVQNSVRPEQVLTNTASLIFDSHPGDPGSVFQRDYGPFTDSTRFTVERPEISKGVVATDIDGTGTVEFDPTRDDVAIGESVTYLITLRLAEQTTTLVVTDDLPASTGAPPVAGDMEMRTARVVSIGANIQGSLLSVGDLAVISDGNGDGILSRAVWNFGTITNVADNVESDADLIVLEVVGRVMDRPSNVAGDILINSAQAQYARADGSTRLVTSAAAVEVVAPELTIQKDASVGTGDAGDVVTYTVTIGHDALSTASAYKLVLTDVLGAGLELIAHSVTTSLAGALVVRGNGASDTDIAITLAALEQPGTPQSLVVTYQARLLDSVRGGDVLPNTARLDWQSAPIGFPVARPDSASDGASVTVLFPVALDKSVVATSLVETGSGFYVAANPDLAVGEEVTYEITVTLGEGTQKVLVEDLLPAGLTFVSGEVVSIGAGISGAALLVGAAPTQIGGAITFDFGNTVLNAGDNVLDAGDTIVMRVVARLAPGVTAGDALPNAAKFTHDTGTLTDTAPVDAVAPVVTITKTPSVSIADAGDVVTFTVVVAQAGSASAPLYDLDVSDILPSGYALVAGSASATRGTVSEPSANGVRLQLAGAALLPTDDPATVGVDETRITLTYQASLLDAVRPGQVLTNTAAYTGASAPSTAIGPVQPYGGQDDAVVTVAIPTLGKAVVATSLAQTGDSQFTPGIADLAIGETVTYAVTVTLPEGTMPVRVLDLLPSGVSGPGTIAWESSAITAIGGGISGGAGLVLGAQGTVTDSNADGVLDSILWDFGTLVNAGDNDPTNDAIVFTVVGRVIDRPENVAGDRLVNTATLDFDGAGATPNLVATADVEIVEPALGAPVKDADIAAGDAGDLVTYTVTIPRAGSATAPAFDVLIEDSLPSSMVLVARSATLNLDAARYVVESGGADGDTVLRIRIAEYLLTDPASLTLTYQARIVDAVRDGDVITNTVSLDYTSAPGTTPGERVYARQTDDAVVVVDFVVDLTKAITATSNPDTGSDRFDPALPDVTVGETVTYRLVATLGEGTQRLVVTDLMPAGLEALSASVVSIGARISGSSLVVGSVGTITGDDITFDFGSAVTNAGDNLLDANDTIVMEVTARVRDITTNVAGTTLSNAAIGTSDTGTGTVIVPPQTVEVVEPELDITKSVDVLGGDAGDVFTYTVTLRHAAASTAGAYDVVVLDALDAVFEPVSAVASQGTASISGNTIRLDLPAFLTTDAPVVVTYVVKFRDAIEPGQIVRNTAALSWDSNPGTGGRTGTDQASAADVTGVFALDLTKSIIATSLAETNADQFDAALPDLAIGETLTYRLVATLSEGTQNLVIRDTLPPGLGLVSASVTAVGAGLSPTLLGVANTGTGQGILFDFGAVVNTGNNLAGDGTITIAVIARVLDVAGNAAGTVLTNAAEAEVTAPTAPGNPGGRLTDSAAASAEVVLPDAVISKSTTFLTGDAGDEVLFTILVTQRAGATAPLYDLVVNDPIPPGLAIVVGSVTTTRGSVALGNGAGDTALRVTVAGLALLPADDPATGATDEASITITYRASLTDAVEPGQVIVNTAAFLGLSAPEAGAGGQARPFSGSDNAEIGVRMPVALEKTIVATSLAESGTGQFDPALVDLAIGETLTYRLVATLSEGTQSLLIADSLPNGLEFLSASVTAVGAGLSPALLGVANTGTGQGVLFDFGTVVNAGNILAGDGTVTIEVLARVRDVPGNIAGTTLTNAGSVTIAAPTNPGATGGTEQATDSVTAEVVEPTLLLDKQAPPAFVGPGETIAYTVTLSHAPGSTAAAYDIVLADLLADPWLELVPGTVTTSRGSITLGNDPNDTTLRIDLAVLDLGQTVSIGFTARVAANAPGGLTLTNSVTSDFDSAGGPGGRPDSLTDGTETPGAPALAKTITATSNPDTGSDRFDPVLPDLAVGETVTYQLTITLPQGSIEDLTLSDLLPASLKPLDARVFAVGSGITAGAPLITVSGQSVSLAFGTVVNGSSAAIGDEDRITVEIDARVVDLAGLTAGDALVNAAGAAFTIGGRPGTLAVNAPAELVEPELDITKSVDVVAGDAGDVFTYTVTLTHAAASTAAAYDVVVLDALDAVFEPVSATASQGTASISGNTIRLDLPAFLITDAPVVVTYVVKFRDAIEPGQVVGNTAALSWDSNPGTGGRPGTDQASAAEVTGVFALDLTKSIIATSLPETGAGQFDAALPDLAIGETLTYQLVATLSEGTQNLVIRDTLPAGLGLVSASVTAVGAGLSPALLGVANTGSGQGILFDFGTVVNTGNNLAGDGTITIAVIARVLDVAGNAAGTVLTNAAGAEVTAPTAPGNPGGRLTDSAAASAEVVLPDAVISKSTTFLTGDAGDEVLFTILVTQRAGATAPLYDLVVNDPIPAGLAIVAGSVTTTRGSVALGNGAGDTALRVAVAGLALLPADDPATGATDEASITITYRARLTDAVEPGQVIVNTAAFLGLSAPEAGAGGQARPFSGSDDAAIGVRMPVAFEKTIIATSLAESGTGQFDPALVDLAVGERVTYRLLATLSEGTQNLVIADSLPAGLELLSASVTAVGAGLSPALLGVANSGSGQGVLFDFGTVVNAGNNLAGDGTVTIEVLARVRDVPGNIAGTTLTNAGSATTAAPTNPGTPGGTEQATDSVTAEVVLPGLLIDKAVDRTTGDAGDVFTYTLTISNDAVTTAASYNLVISDPLSPFLAVVPGSLAASLGRATILGNTIRVEIPVLLPDAAPVVITYRAAFTDAIEPGQVVPNRASLDYATAPDAGRALSERDEAAVAGAFSLALTKQVVATSLPETGAGYFDPALADISAGETVTFRLTATIAEGTLRLVVTDTLPAGLVAESARLVSLGTGIAASAPSITLTDGRVAFDFGTVVNAGDNQGGDQLVLEVVARRNALPAAGTVLTNAAEASVLAPTLPEAPGGSFTASAEASVEAVAAILAFDKQAGPAVVALGEPITYTLTLNHAPGSTAPAYDVTLADPLSDAALQLIPGTVVTSAGTVVSGNAVGDAVVIVEVPVLLPGQVVTVSFQGRAIGFPTPDGQLPNTAGFESSSAPGPVPPGFVIPLDGLDSALVQVSSGARPELEALFAAYEETFRRIRMNGFDAAVVLAGTAEPGATVTVLIRDANGASFALIMLTADVGGNWVTSGLQNRALPQGDTGVLGELFNIAGRERPSNGDLPRPPSTAVPLSPTSAPYTVQAGASPPAFEGRDNMDGLRVTFGGAIQPGGMFTGAPNAVGSQAAASMFHAMQRDQEGLRTPVSLAWNRFALDFAASEAAAAVPGR